MTDADWPFANARNLPEKMWELINLGAGVTAPEQHFIRVLWFHADFLNGGLNQVIYNVQEFAKQSPEAYARSFDELGLPTLADIVRKAAQTVTVGKTWQSVFNRDPADLDKAYKKKAFGSTNPGKWRTDRVANAALRYAREHRPEFAAFIMHYRKVTGG